MNKAFGFIAILIIAGTGFYAINNIPDFVGSDGTLSTIVSLSWTAGMIGLVFYVGLRD